MTYKLKVLQQELEQEGASHKATRSLLADKSKIKVTIEGAKSESMKGEADVNCRPKSEPLESEMQIYQNTASVLHPFFYFKISTHSFLKKNKAEESFWGKDI